MDAVPSSNTPTAETSNIPYPLIPLFQVLLHTIAPLLQPSEISPPIPPPSTVPPAPLSKLDDASSDCPAYAGPLPLSLPLRTTEPTTEVTGPFNADSSLSFASRSSGPLEPDYDRTRRALLRENLYGSLPFIFYVYPSPV